MTMYDRTAPEDGSVVDIQNLGVGFASDRGAVKAVDGVSLTVRRGEVLDVDDRGALVVAGPEGTFTVGAGDVVHVRPQQ